ncbi:MAG TPA: hypothetical protein VFD70_08285 [Anaerolineae bacterium]|nr:hypothetical protein [Anaerolineae bacterium]
MSGSTSRPTALIVLSVVCSILAVFFVPPFFGIAGLVLGYLVYRRDPSSGQLCLALAGAGLVIGIVLGVVIGSQTFR